MGLITYAGWDAAVENWTISEPSLLGTGGPTQPHVDYLRFGHYQSAWDGSWTRSPGFVAGVDADLQLIGAGGPTQANVDYIIFGNPNHLWDGAWTRSPGFVAPTVDQLDGDIGPTQPNVNYIRFGASGFTWDGQWTLADPFTLPDPSIYDGDIGPTQTHVDYIRFGTVQQTWDGSWILDDITAPTLAQLDGDDSAITQPHVDYLIIGNPVAPWDGQWTLSGGIPSARFTWTYVDRLLKPGQVQFDATTSTGGGFPYTLQWDFGDNKTAGNNATPVHQYEEFEQVTVVLSLTQVGGIGLVVQDIQVLDLVDIRPAALESDDDVLNLELGRHVYEPIRTTGGQEQHHLTAFRQYNAVNVAPEQEAKVIEFEVTTQQISISHIRVSGDCNGVFRVLVDGDDILPSRRVHRGEQGLDLLDGAVTSLRIGQVIEILVRGTQDINAVGKFEAALIGRKSLT